MHDTSCCGSGTDVEETGDAPVERNKGDSDLHSTETIVETSYYKDVEIDKLPADAAADYVGTKGIGMRIA